MSSSPYLTSEELNMLNDLCQHEGSDASLTLPLVLDANIVPLLEQASCLELTFNIGEVKLSFPVALSHPVTSQEQAELSPPNIITNVGQPRAWRLPHPQHIRLKSGNGQLLAVEIRDLSVNGMRLLSARPLFRASKAKQALSTTQPAHKPAHKKVQLELGQEQCLPLQLTLVRQRKGPHFWLTIVQFELNSADKTALSDFVFRGFLAQINNKQAP